MIPPYSIQIIHWQKTRRPPMPMYLNIVTKAVTEALANGGLVRQPCVICGARPAHAHHADYEKPLDVTFLCPRHHTRFHALLGKRFWSLNQSYSLAFHDRVLAELKREFMQREFPFGKGREVRRWRQPIDRHCEVALEGQLTKSQTADELGVSVRTVDELIRDGKLIARQISGARTIRILRADLFAFLETTKVN